MMKNKQFVSKLTSIGLMLVMMFFVANTATADKITYKDNWGKQGITVEKQSTSSVELNYSITEFFLESASINGESMNIIQLPGHFLPNDEGAPDLPGNGRYIAVPQGAVPVLNIISMDIETIQNVDLAPAPRIPLDTEKGPLHYEKNAKIFSKDAFYPAEPFKLSELTQIRGVDAVMLGMTPFQYNPVTKELKVYTNVKIEITFEGGNGHIGEDRLRNRWWEPIHHDIFLNNESLPKVDFSKQYTDDEDYEYIIITPNGSDFVEWANVIKDFRTKQGIKTNVVTLAEIGGNNAGLIEDYTDEVFGWTNPPAAILLLGDYGTSAENSVTSPTWNNYCISDNLYADVTGNHMPDIVFARITAQNASQLETMVNKFIDYENNPPTIEHYYNHPITAMGWQTERWFQICSETINGFWEFGLGKEPLRENAIYQGSPTGSWSSATNTSTVVNYFGPNGLGYIPATPNHLTDWGGSAARINNDINSGAFMMQHRDHGGNTGWGEPDYQSSDINGLSNVGLPIHVFSINCLTGKFNLSGECFAEKFHRHPQGGALGITAASEVSYSFVNDTYVWGMYDNMWPEFMPDYGCTPAARGILPAFGNAAGKYFLQQSNWPYNTNNKEVTYYLFHHHGDAFSTVYTEMPQDLTINHEPVLLSGPDFFTVTANEGSLICLSVDGVIIGVGEGTGGPVDIYIEPQIPPAMVDLVITKQNFYRYETQVQVIPPDGAYVVKDSYEINDANQNGQMDYNESILLSLAVKNVGNEDATNVTVTISTEDEYITITDDTEFYGLVPANGIVNIVDGFAFDVAANIPDGHNVNFGIVATDGTNSWNSGFSIEGHAPVLEFAEFVVSGDGKIDPGETVDIAITVENTGTSEAYNVLGELLINDPYVTVNTSQQNYGDVIGGATAEQSFSVTADAATPAGHMANFIFEIAADFGITGDGNFNVVIGQIPVLIIDFDENTNSGIHMQTSIENLGMSCEYMTSMPADLNLYTSIFVCLGIYSDNHVLSSGEGSALAAYLNAGGQLYMEGGDTWYYDTQTAAHAMFNINGQADGSSDLGTINGQAGTFTEGLNYSYSGDNSWIDHIAAISPAVLIYENQSPNYGCGVAYDEGTYRTIGCSFEFGGLDEGASTIDQLMEQYLIFFGFGNDPDIQTINLNTGYQFSSTRIAVENPDMLVVLNSILNENLDFVRNSNGEVLRKIGPNWVNGIGDWVTTGGYLFKMFGAEVLNIEGEAISTTTPIDLFTGYQFVSYLPDVAVDAIVAFDNILNDDLDYVRNSNGEMLRKIGPNWVNGLGDLNPGEGYLIKMFADGQLVYNESTDGVKNVYIPKVMNHFTFEGGNAAEAVYSLYVSGLNIGDEVAVYDGDKMVGASVVISENTLENSVPIFSVLTNGLGYESNNEMTLKVWDVKYQSTVSATYTFDNEYTQAFNQTVFPETDGKYSVLNVTKGSLGMMDNANLKVDIYPNPASDVLNIVSNNTITHVRVLNFVGQTMLDNAVNGTSLNINTSVFQSGVYIIRIETANGIITEKVTIK